MSHDPPQLFLVDGHALIYRAFYALIARPLRTSRGENTSAAWGIINFLLRLREKYRPEYLVWVLDAGDSFRKTTYPEYKSTREKLDEQLQQDFDLAITQVSRLLAVFRVPVLSVAGYEADDVIGTLAERYAADGKQVVIVSGDKDFYQLVGPRVALLNPGRGGPAGVEEHWVDESNATERLGVPPSQVTDWLALVGDTADNIPGVKGIGEKGAVLLLQEFGTLEALLERAGEVKQKRSREALAQFANEARLSKGLVTIRKDVPVELDLANAVLREPDREGLVRICVDLEFHSLARRFAGAAPTPTAEPDSGEDATAEPSLLPGEVPAPIVVVVQTGCEPEVVDDPARLPAIAEQIRSAEIVSLDTEAGAAEPRDADLVGISLAIAKDKAWYFPFGHLPRGGALAAPAPVNNLPPITDPACAPIADLLRDASVRKAGHNIKYDWQVLRRAGVELAGVVFDTMLASFVLDPGRRSHGLDTLCLDHLSQAMRSYADLTGKGKEQLPFAEVSVSEAARYCAADSTTVLALREVFAPRLAATALQPLLDNIELPLVEVLVDMEWAGIAIDKSVFDRLSRELTQDLIRLEREIGEAAGAPFNINSPRQLQTVLFERLGLPVLKRTKTGPSTDADVLEQLAANGAAVPKLLLEYRELQKLRSTYVDVLPLKVHPVTGRIHTNFSQVGAATGRLSSSEPNLQNIPIRTVRGQEIRKGFVPAPGWKFVIADYSQIELRLMAHLSGDPAFIDAFTRGQDIHRQTAAIIFNVPLESVTPEMRGRAKTINFGTIYGQGAFALSRMLGIPQDEAKAFISEYFRRFAGVRAYLDRQVALARQQGFVETLFGRRRYVPEIKDRNFNTRAFGERISQNAPLQGSAADLIKIAMTRLHRALREEGLSARLLLQVHDELVLESPPAEIDRVTSLVKIHMEGAASLAVPLVVEVGVGDNWLDAK